METEKTKEQIKQNIKKIGYNFNWNEILGSEKSKLLEASQVSEIEDFVDLQHREDYLLAERDKYVKMNYRFVQYKCVDRIEKYSDFYLAVRKLYEAEYPPKSIEMMLKDLWQILDLAIENLENDLNCCFRDEVNLFWFDRIAELFDSSRNDYLDNIQEFMDFSGLLYGIQDYRLLGVIEREYNYDLSYNDAEEKHYISWGSNSENRVSYDDLWSKFSNDLVGRVSSKISDIGKLLISKFTKDELLQYLSIEKIHDDCWHKSVSLEVGYSKWYEKLVLKANGK